VELFDEKQQHRERTIAEVPLMSKKRKTVVPQFGTSRTPGRPLKPGETVAPHAAPPPAARIKPQSIPVKSSGHRGA